MLVLSDCVVVRLGRGVAWFHGAGFWCFVVKLVQAGLRSCLLLLGAYGLVGVSLVQGVCTSLVGAEGVGSEFALSADGVASECAVSAFASLCCATVKACG